MGRMQQERDNGIRWIMTALFVLFAFGYIVLFQRDLIALMQETWSHGQTHNNPLVTFVVATTLLLLLQVGVRSLLDINGRWEAFSYLPSLMLLAFFTDVDTHTFCYQHAGKWITVFVLTVIGIYLLPRLGRMKYPDSKASLVTLLQPNLVTFVLGAVLCMALSCHDAPLHMELAAWRHAASDEPDRVASVGRRSLETTPSLTALRNVALCREGRAGDELFTLPQPYGVEGLGVDRYMRRGTRFGCEVFDAFVGAAPYGGEGVMDFCKRMAQDDASPHYRDLYMAALLLDGQLQTFARQFPPSALGDTLAPRHYREAWLLYEHLCPDSHLSYHDAALEPLLEACLEIRVADTASDGPGKASSAGEHLPSYAATPEKEAENRRMLAFGDTYWHYYLTHFGSSE